MNDGKIIGPKYATREKVFRFIVDYKTKHGGNSPAFRDIMLGCEISSTSTVNYHLQQLEIEGRIKVLQVPNSKKRDRSITVIGGEWVFHEEYVDPPVDKA